MNELIFENLEIRNFLSVGNKPLHIDFNRGINFVTGWNYSNESSNGCGKTVVFYSAVLYGLFGETGRDIKQKNIINYHNKGRMSIQLNLKKNGDTIVIYRSKKPNDFYYIHKGIKYQNANVHETQNQLNKLLDITEDIFTNVFIINASDTLDFIKEEGSVKLRDRFEKIFFKDIIFKKILEVVRKEYNVATKQMEVNNSKMTEKIEFLKRLKKCIEDAKKTDVYEKQILDLKEKRTENELQLTKIKEKIQKGNQKEQLSELNKKKEEFLAKRDDITSNIFYKEQKIKEFAQNLKIILSSKKQCPICLQPLDEHTFNKIKEEYEKEIKTFSSELNEFKEKKLKYDEQLRKVKELETKIRNAIEALNLSEVNVQNQISKIDRELKFFSENNINQEKIQTEFNTVKNDFFKLKKENSVLITDISDLELLSSIFDNSAGGILTFFINKVLLVLNQTITKYIKKMQMDFLFHFDNDLRLNFSLGEGLALNNFSGGEKKIINFIVLFSLIEFFFNTLNFRPSIFIIDEVADTSVSAPKLELLFKIIGQFHKENNIGVYLLSHSYSHQHNSVLDFDNVIELIKKDGFTSIKEIKSLNP